MAGNSARLIQKAEFKRTKDPSSSQRREAGQFVRPSKRGDRGEITTGTTKTDVCEKPPRRKSPPKGGNERQSTPASAALHGKGATSTQMADNIVEILKESFASLSQSMSEGFDTLGQMLQGSRFVHMLKESHSPDELSSTDSDVSDVEELVTN